MRLIRTAGALVAALVMAGGLAAPVAAAPLQIEWVDDSQAGQVPQQLVVDPATGDALALAGAYSGSEVLRRLDADTGAVEWTVPVPGMTHFAADPSTGQVVLVGSRDAGQFLTFVSADGSVVGPLATTVTAKVMRLAVDAGTGQVCTLGQERRRSATPNAWVTACWTSAGQPVFADTWQPPAGSTVPNALAIDPSSHRVYTAGTSRPKAGRHKKQETLVLIAHDASGAQRWKRVQRGVFAPGWFDMAVDPQRGRIHLVNQPSLIQSPMELYSFDARGTLRFTRSWEDLGSVYTTDVGVTPEGDVLVVGGGAATATLRAYAPSGRVRSKAVVRIARDRRENYLQEIAIDPRRGLAHLLAGGGDTPIRVASFTFRGKKRSDVVVDRRHAIFGEIAVDPAVGRVYTSVALVDDPAQRITALSR
ncbi:outer membrane protein assembly factor BamB [Nocardioides cavernae]|uniref:Outer membrane protein assembly factor BamB n=1 Tax=Nocardioides cavernae TaxID=1921566 RepID=A0A7Y9KRM4_9ACTN|nr:hypothetical protein [Nocardioides cavernae]NYE36704.1 outer membrane protein assembly factor BamB [Nocardioides cavernae]